MPPKKAHTIRAKRARAADVEGDVLERDARLAPGSVSSRGIVRPSSSPSNPNNAVLEQVCDLRRTIAKQEAVAAALQVTSPPAPRAAPKVVWPAFAACPKCSWRGHSDVMPHHMRAVHGTGPDTPKLPRGVVPEELECAICMEPLENAMLVVGCGHSFCSHCLDSHFKAQVDREKTCPTCRGSAAATVIDARSRRLCGALTTECKVEGCTWKGRQDERAAHVSSAHEPPRRSARSEGYKDPSRAEASAATAAVSCIVTRAVAERGFCFLSSPHFDGRIFLHASVCEQFGVHLPAVADELLAVVEQTPQGLRVKSIC